ncbi:6,7-dimethyl-8-ribityllumazine synthase [Chitinolyticbacter meiyuanensis]|uniref:6,7-dimethyl-8-ribityllumazine synthase n=1 Tax=Chitinolyticbacter meiyuanensis TaxID=682798 RepID=UPI0011E5AC5C|nr:6,7-dimethyl-8-ribityllumazine synthase [Chitinolyticbacter meiyuanensis]
MNQPLNAVQTLAFSHPPHRIAFISASWHHDIVSQASQAAQAALIEQAPGSAIAQFDVPGAFEIPLHAKRLAASGQFDAIIAFGLVVNGGIYRHEFVTAAVIDGLMRVQLDSDVPVFSAVLTPRDFHEHDEHQAFFRSHFVTKGREVAQACLATLHSLSHLPVAVAA